MQTVFAEWGSRMTTLPADLHRADLDTETGDEELPESDGISARGLEILRVLNDVFNGLPSETAGCQAD
jgi:hypothetical protein